MKSNKLACFFITLLCSQILSSLALDNVSPSENTVELDQQIHGVQGAAVSKGIEYEVKEERVYSIKGQKGKGSYGGANINHKPARSGSREISKLTGPSIYVSSAGICLSFYIFSGFSSSSS